MKSFIVFLCIFSSLKIIGQNQLVGTVKSINAQPLPNVLISIPDLKIGTMTDAKGHYNISLPVGTYLIESTLIGHINHIDRVTINGSVTLDITLVVSGLELPAVIVTGVPEATEQRKNPVPVSMLSKSDLLHNTYTNIIDAISVIPGVSQITLGASISKPEVRGLGYNRVLVINDGVRQEGQQWFDEFGIEIDENSVNKVEVLKGPASLSYGSDAMAGVINFLSPAIVQQGTVKANLLGSYQTNNGLMNGSVNIAGNKKGFSWDLLYTGLFAHNYKNKYDGYVWNSGYSENNLKGIFGLNKNWGYSHLVLSMFNLKPGIIEGLRDSATGMFETHHLDRIGGDSLAIAPTSNNKKYNNYPIIHQHVRHYKAVLDNRFLMGSGRLDIKLGLQYNHRQEANDITRDDIYNNYFYLTTLNYDIQYLLSPKNKWQVSFGVNGMQQSSADKGIVFVLPEYSLFDIGAFSIAKKTFNKLTVSGGLRYDSRMLHGKDLYVDSNGVRIPTAKSNSVRRFTAYNSNFKGFSGSIGLAYDFTKELYGKINLARGFRAPTAAESGQNGIHDGTPFFEIGDHNLKAENSLQLDATLGISSDDVTVELNAFSNRINNYIFPEKLASIFGGDSIRNDIVAGFSGPTFKYVAGDAVVSGGELMIDIHPRCINWLRFENAISSVRSIQLNHPDSSKYLPYTPPTKLQSRVKVQFSKLNSTLQHLFFNIGIDNYFEQNKIFYQFGNETVTPGYTLLNAGLGVDICSVNKTLCTLIVSGTNLTDKAYQSNMSRLKYTDTNHLTSRQGVFNMGRNISFKLLVPF